MIPDLPRVLVIGDSISMNYHEAARAALTALLEDEHANTRMLAAIALGKLGHREDVAHLVKLLESNTGGDAYLRHGTVHGMRLIAEASDASDELLKFKGHASAEVRLGLIIALRRLGDPDIRHFLTDEEPSLVIETIQAINDGYIEEARPALAAATHLVGTSTTAINYRIINSIVRVGGPEGALALLALAENDSLPEGNRVEALVEAKAMLGRRDVFDCQVALGELSKLPGGGAAVTVLKMLQQVNGLPLAIQLPPCRRWTRSSPRRKCGISLPTHG